MDSHRPSSADAPSGGGQAGTPTTLVWLVGGLFVIALLWLLQAGASVFLPLAVAFFLAVSVLPVKRAIASRLPDPLGWLGDVAAAGIVVAFLLLFFAGIGIATQQVAGSADEIVPQVQQRLAELPFASAISDSLPQLLDQVRSYALALTAGLGSTLGALVVVFFLMLLTLIEAGDWRKKAAAVSSTGQGRHWQAIADSVGQKFRRYFLTRLALGSITGVLYVAWLAIFGTPLLLVWGILALLLNFIPTIGSLIAGILPVIFVFAQQDAATALIVAAGILMIEQIMGNYVDPKITGRQLSVSPLVVLASLLLWTWVWGIPGALISTPMTMLIIVIFAHFQALRPIALLLSEETDMGALDRAISPSL